MCAAASEKRNYSMDYLRIIACFMVICAHVTAAWKGGQYGTFEWMTAILYDCLSRSAIALFFMLSGAFYKKKTFMESAKKILRFAVVFFAWSLFYTLADLYWKTGKCWGNLGEILYGMLNYKYHLWFLPSYILVLSIAPIIVRVMDSEESKDATKYILFFWIVLGVGIHTVRASMDGIEKYEQIHQFLGMIQQFTFLSDNDIGFFVFGRYLFQRNVGKQTRIALYLTSIFSTILLFIITCIYSRRAGSLDDRWYSSQDILVLLQATGLFLFFKTRPSGNWKQKKNVCEIMRKTSFGVYLVHVFFLDVCYQFGFFHGNFIGRIAFNPIIGVPARVVIIYLFSFCSVFLYHRIPAIIRYSISTAKTIGSFLLGHDGK